MKNSYSIETIKNKKIISEYINEFGTSLLLKCVRAILVANKQEIPVMAKNIDFLLEHGADINRSNLENITPLMIAVEANHQSLANFLVTKGASINNTHLLDQYKKHPIVKNLLHAYTPTPKVSSKDYLILNYSLDYILTIPEKFEKFSKAYVIMQTILGGSLLTISSFLGRGVAEFPVFQFSWDTLTSIPKQFSRNEIYQGILQQLLPRVVAQLPETLCSKTLCIKFINNLPTLLTGYQLTSFGYQLYSYYSNQLDQSTASPGQCPAENHTAVFMELVNSIAQTCSWGSAADPHESGLAFPNRLENVSSLINPWVSRECYGNSGTIGV